MVKVNTFELVRRSLASKQCVDVSFGSLTLPPSESSTLFSVDVRGDEAELRRSAPDKSEQVRLARRKRDCATNLRCELEARMR